VIRRKEEICTRSTTCCLSLPRIFELRYGHLLVPPVGLTAP
jgi:hypothetical protein